MRLFTWRIFIADTSTYKPLPADPTACITNKIKQLVDSMHDSGYIDKYTHAFLCPPEKVRTQRMYFLKKLHKTPHGIRPIVSGCSGPTERVSAFLDHIIKPLVPTTPSYIKDSSHIIALLECTNIPKDALLVTIDVSSLYTNIPQDEGTEACLEAIETAEASHIPQSILLELFNIVLKCNVFSFDNSMYQQIQGTAMGTKMTSSYANLFKDRFERAFLAQEPILPLVWKRYIDDILCIWTGTRSQLDSFLDGLNKAHHSIKFTWSISDTQIQFLDLNIHKGQRFSQTNLLDLKTYFKPTNTFQYLHFASSHPRSVYKGLVKGEVIRFLRSNTHAPTFTNTICIFKKHLLHRKYPEDFIDRFLNRITHDLRPTYIPTLNPSPNPSPSPSPRLPPRLITTYSPHYVHLNSLLTKHWQLISEDPTLSTLFPSPPQVCYRGNPTLSCSLVRAALPGPSPPQYKVVPITINTIVSRSTKCTSPYCKACTNALGRCILYSTVSRTPYTFSEPFTCTDTSLIYCILCSKCDKMYIGLTSQSIRQRFNAHRYAAKRKLRIPLYRHFSRRSHDFDRDHRIVPLEHCEPDALAEREQYWIRTLNTKLPHGLNSMFIKPYYPQSLTSQ